MSTQTDLQAEIDRLRAGADPTPRADDAYPTPGQLWKQLLEDDEEGRMKALGRLIDMASKSDARYYRLEEAEQLARAWVAQGAMRSMEATTVAKCGAELLQALGRLTD